MRLQKPRIQGQIGQLQTSLDGASRAPQPQGAGAIPVPPAPTITETKWLLADVLGAARLLFEPLAAKTAAILLVGLCHLARTIFQEAHSMLLRRESRQFICVSRSVCHVMNPA
jgi:hypothetical protein